MALSEASPKQHQVSEKEISPDEIQSGAMDEVLTDFTEQKDPPIVWWAALVGPVLATLAALVMVYFVSGWPFVTGFVTAAATAFFVTGRFIILLGAEQAAEGKTFLKLLTPTHLFVMLTWLDMMVAIFVAFHMAVLFRVPWAGEKLKGLVSDGRFVLAKQPWIRRAAFSGLVLFVIFPTSTTGSIGGTIFGRLLGMRRVRVLIAIFTGSILGNGIMLLGANFFNKYFSGDSLVLKVSGVLAIIIALFFFERKIKSLKEKYLAEEANQQA